MHDARRYPRVIVSHELKSFATTVPPQVGMPLGGYHYLCQIPGNTELWKIPTQYTFNFDVGVRGKMTCSRVVRYLV
jgi:hypothetical protein